MLYVKVSQVFFQLYHASKLYILYEGWGCNSLGRVLSMHEPWARSPEMHKPGVVAHSCNPSTLDVKAEG